MRVVINGRPISKKNNRRQFRRVNLPSEAYVRFEKDAKRQLQEIGEQVKGLVHIDYTFYMKGKLDSDTDNMIGGVNDIIQDVGIIENDKLIISGTFQKIAGCKDWQTVLEIASVPPFYVEEIL